MGLTVANYLAQPLFPDCDPPDGALRLIAAVSGTLKIWDCPEVIPLPLRSDLYYWADLVELLQYQGHNQTPKLLHGKS